VEAVLRRDGECRFLEVKGLGLCFLLPGDAWLGEESRSAKKKKDKNRVKMKSKVKMGKIEKDEARSWMEEIFTLVLPCG
jgi:hypothetical protein